MQKKASVIKKELSDQIDNVIEKIIKRAKVYPLGVYGYSAKIAIESSQNVLFIKELKQQIISCRESMTDMFGLEIIADIDKINVKVKRVRRPSIFKKMTEISEC